MIDIAFILDESGSVGISNWNKMIDFVKDIVGCFQVAPDKVHFAAVTFGTAGKVEFLLGQYNSQSAVNTAFDNIVYNGGATNIAAGLTSTRVNVFGPAKDRARAANIAIIIADGNHNHGPNPRTAATELKKEAFIISIGVTGGINVQLMKDISSNNKVTHVSSFNQLDNIVGDIVKEACDNTGESICIP